MRWVVGDLQGCAAELDDLLAAIRFDPARDELWCAGDLVNRGPESLRTLELWAGVGGRAVLGNHEVYALCVHAGRWPRKPDTLDDLRRAPDYEHWLAVLRALPVLVHLPAVGDGPDAWLVHAGLHPHWTDPAATAAAFDGAAHDDDWLESEPVSFATRVRCCTPAGERCRFTGPPAECPAPFAPWDTFHAGPSLVVHGHWASRGHYRGAHTLGLDSGCVYGGRLTAWCQDEDRIVSVPAR